MKGSQWLLLPTICLASVSLIAQVRVSTLPAHQGFNPLNPTQVNHPVITGKSQTPDQLLGTFTVTNYSTKHVAAIEYGWRIAAAARCAGHTLEPQWGHYDSTAVSIAPGAEAEIQAPPQLAAKGSSKALANLASNNKANVVLVTIGLLKVIYRDGSMWQDTEALSRRMFDAGEAELSSDCKIPAKPVNSARCSKPNIDQLLGKGDKSDAKLLRAFYDYTCRNQYCTPWQILVSGTCDWTVCNIYCCGPDCTDACQGYCDSALWPLRCIELGPL